jgi:hypothetical protein
MRVIRRPSRNDALAFAFAGAGALVLVLLTALVFYLAYFFIEGTLSEDALNKCSRSPNPADHPTSHVTVEWRWWKPGYVCLFLDDNGRVVAEHRP